MRSERADTDQEIDSYLNDPDHLYLNELMARVKCPIKRRRIQQIFDEVANIPQVLEEMRRSVVSTS